jgi:hypothetical protein
MRGAKRVLLRATWSMSARRLEGYQGKMKMGRGGGEEEAGSKQGADSSMRNKTVVTVFE